MKVSFGQEEQQPVCDEVVETATLRYMVAYAEYQGVVEGMAKLTLSGGRPSEQAQRLEERAFEELDCARQALLDAAAQAFPTIH